MSNDEYDQKNAEIMMAMVSKVNRLAEELEGKIGERWTKVSGEVLENVSEGLQKVPAIHKLDTLMFMRECINSLYDMCQKLNAVKSQMDIENQGK
jgi:hypothetical protein